MCNIIRILSRNIKFIGRSYSCRIELKERYLVNRIILKLEGLFVLLFCIYFYSTYDYGWGLFLFFLLLPDISMLGYLINVKIGALFYNLFHTYVTSTLPLVWGIITHSDLSIIVGLIWTAHIGMDRLLGYGLKYPTHFKDTHFLKI
jgi:hypothetical protein